MLMHTFVEKYLNYADLKKITISISPLGFLVWINCVSTKLRTPNSYFPYNFGTLQNVHKHLKNIGVSYMYMFTY